jgi:hypothetical protein
MAVKIPTKAMIPKAIISKVSIARSILARIFCNDILSISESGMVYGLIS